MSKHDEFILMPISSLICESIAGSFGIGCGMETYPVSINLLTIVSTYR